MLVYQRVNPHCSLRFPSFLLVFVAISPCFSWSQRRFTFIGEGRDLALADPADGRGGDVSRAVTAVDFMVN